MKAPTPAAIVAYTWSGWYVGGNVGYSWGRSRTNVDFFTNPGGVLIVPPAGSITSFDSDLDGWIGGGQIGANWQTGQFVLGGEADIQWSGQKGSSSYLCAATVIGGPCLPGLTFLPAGATGSSLALSQKLQWFGTVRGRIGVTPVPTWLLYLTGGLAYGEIKTSGTLAGFTANGTAIVTTGASSDTNFGWTVGGGAEGVISGPWTGKIEYLYMDLGSVSSSFIPLAPAPQAVFTSRITDHILRAGLNYRFVQQ